MTATRNPEYRKLELDSSNDMIEHDADRGLGRYAEAAWHILQAGIARVRMGQMMSDAGEFVLAAEDWLSASECFYLVPNLEQMRETFDRVKTLDQEGKIPPERRDIHAALKEREEQIKGLEHKLKQSWQDYDHMVGPTRSVSQQALDFLRKQVRELPGSPKLHAEIFRHAQRLGQHQLAIEHLDWAQKFDPGSPHLGALRVGWLIIAGERSLALQMSHELLTAYPEMDSLRILRAQALVFHAEAQVADWEMASEILQPLIENGSTDSLKRLLAISLAAILQHRLGHEAEYRHLLNSFDQLAQTIQSPAGKGMVSEVRPTLSRIIPQPGSNGTPPAFGNNRPAELDSSVRRVFEELNTLFAGAA